MSVSVLVTNCLRHLTGRDYRTQPTKLSREEGMGMKSGKKDQRLLITRTGVR